MTSHGWASIVKILLKFYIMVFMKAGGALVQTRRAMNY